MSCLRIVVLNCVFTVSLVNPFILYQRIGENEKEIELSDKGCKCIAAFFCSDDDNKDLNGEGLMDVRSLNQACENYFDVCCENPIKDFPKEIDAELFKGCGYKNPQGVATRITSNSEQAQFGELPWNAIILSNRNLYKCGGSLIHPQVALTTAHCVIGSESKQLIVRAGEWNTRSQDEPIPHQDIFVQEVVIHQHYHEKSLRNDIALLFLAESFVMTENIGIICLPPQHLEAVNSANILCTASGWGKDAFKKGKHSSILKKVNLPLISRDDCQHALRKTRLGPFYTLHNSFVCAGGEKNKDTCKGDGGSPLICPVQGEGNVERYFQMGIVSWGIGCGEDETPGVYANLPFFTDWIDKQMLARNFDTTVYKY